MSLQISTDIIFELKSVLGDFNEFNSNMNLLTTIKLTEIGFFADEIPLQDYGSKGERIDACLTFLLSKRLVDGRSALLILLNFLQSRVQDERKQRLDKVVVKIKSINDLEQKVTVLEPITTVLFLAADPTDAARLRLGAEFSEIRKRLTQSQLQSRFKLELPHLSVRADSIIQTLLDTPSHIVHFSGHGSSTGALCFENQDRQTHLVHPDALSALFKEFSHQVNCVLLNACYSEIQAKAIAKHVEFVIGMNYKVSDEAAIAFSTGFYQALGSGRTTEEAFEFGRIQIMLQDIPEHLTPVLIKKRE